MTDQQWKTLVAVVRGEAIRPLPTAFIIDSPWLPNWAGHTILDYFTDERIFLDDNLKAIRTFPEAIFLPGFWSEFGMCTEPSAFGSVSIWGRTNFPSPGKFCILRPKSSVWKGPIRASTACCPL
jgi:uroporphyrinogen decarboxylase